jgi:hypothetical protein
VDPKVQETLEAYLYVGDDPVNNTDPTGLCVSVFHIFCLGGGRVTSTVSLGWHPGSGANAIVNIGRGASFGLSDRIANLIHRGASATVPRNSLDEFLGNAASSVVGGELLRGFLSSESVGDWAYNNRWLGADSRLFGNDSFGGETEEGLLNQRSSTWRLGWSVNSRVSPTVPGFRLEAPLVDKKFWILLASGFR